MFVKLDLLLYESMPISITRFSGLFSVVSWDIDLEFLYEFDFCSIWPTFTWVIALC